MTIALDEIPEGPLRDYCARFADGNGGSVDDLTAAVDWIRANFQPSRPLEVGDRVRHKGHRTAYQNCSVIAIYYRWTWVVDNTDGDMSNVFQSAELERIEVTE